MDFLRSYFFKNVNFFHQNQIGGTCRTLQHLISCTALQEIRCYKVLHEKSVPTEQSFIFKEITSLKNHSLEVHMYIFAQNSVQEKCFYDLTFTEFQSENTVKGKSMLKKSRAFTFKRSLKIFQVECFVIYSKVFFFRTQAVFLPHLLIIN